MKSVLELSELERKVWIRKTATERVKNKLKRKYKKELSLC